MRKFYLSGAFNIKNNKFFFAKVWKRRNLIDYCYQLSVNFTSSFFCWCLLFLIWINFSNACTKSVDCTFSFSKSLSFIKTFIIDRQQSTRANSLIFHYFKIYFIYYEWCTIYVSKKREICHFPYQRNERAHKIYMFRMHVYLIINMIQLMGSVI